MPLIDVNFTIRVIGDNPHRRGSDTWRAGQIVEAMEGCHIRTIIMALESFEQNRKIGVADPARWITHFAGLESIGSGKRYPPWIEILHKKEIVRTTANYRKIVRLECR